VSTDTCPGHPDTVPDRATQDLEGTRTSAMPGEGYDAIIGEKNT
jgi:hypothetical protein